MSFISDIVKHINRVLKGNLHKIGRGSQHQLNKREKLKVLENQNYYCAGEDRCKKRHGKILEISIDNCEFDHIIPKALGGSNSMENIQALCPNCHSSKTKKDMKKIRKNKR